MSLIPDLARRIWERSEALLVVEADGGQHGRIGDHDVRDRALREGGWRILRFWNNDIIENREGVL